MQGKKIAGKGHTIIVNTHAIMQKGAHKELLKLEGIYRQFVQIREQTEGWQIV